MAAKKGHKKLGGRKKGVENKVTRDIRQSYKELVEGNLDNITLWMKQVAAGDPAQALDFMIKFAQFSVPMLNKTTHEGGDADKPIQVNVRYVDAGNKP